MTELTMMELTVGHPVEHKAHYSLVYSSSLSPSLFTLSILIYTHGSPLNISTANLFGWLANEYPHV
jgi:hypothetical protein